MLCQPSPQDCDGLHPDELAWWEKELESQGRMVESQRVHQRTRFDLEMIKSVGYCHGMRTTRVIFWPLGW